MKERDIRITAVTVAEEDEMDENLSRGYVQLGKARRMNEFKFSENGFARLSPPVDRWNIIFMSLMLAGAGFLLPYNRFVYCIPIIWHA